VCSGAVCVCVVGRWWREVGVGVVCGVVGGVWCVGSVGCVVGGGSSGGGGDQGRYNERQKKVPTNMSTVNHNATSRDAVSTPFMSTHQRQRRHQP